MNPSIQTRTPVNRQAAMIIQKAPWWAYYNEPAKQAEKIMPKHEWELHADLFNPPPPKKRVTDHPVKDVRGCRVEYTDGNKGVVTGFQNFTPRSDARSGRLCHWWVICEDGVISSVRTGNGRSNRYTIIPMVKEGAR